MATNPFKQKQDSGSLQNTGLSKELQSFEVQDFTPSNQPQDGGSWNPKMGNPVGPK